MTTYESGAALTQMSEIPEDFKTTDDLKKKNKVNLRIEGENRNYFLLPKNYEN